MNYIYLINFIITNNLYFDYGRSNKFIVVDHLYVNRISEKIKFTHSSRFDIEISFEDINKSYYFSFQDFFQLSQDNKVLDKTQFILSYGRDLWRLSEPLPYKIKTELEQHESKII